MLRAAGHRSTPEGLGVTKAGLVWPGLLWVHSRVASASVGLRNMMSTGPSRQVPKSKLGWPVHNAKIKGYPSVTHALSEVLGALCFWNSANRGEYETSRDISTRLDHTRRGSGSKCLDLGSEPAVLFKLNLTQTNSASETFSFQLRF
jgi:hypothetical protein